MRSDLKDEKSHPKRLKYIFVYIITIKSHHVMIRVTPLYRFLVNWSRKQGKWSVSKDCPINSYILYRFDTSIFFNIYRNFRLCLKCLIYIKEIDSCVTSKTNKTFLFVIWLLYSSEFTKISRCFLGNRVFHTTQSNIYFMIRLTERCINLGVYSPSWELGSFIWVT